MKGSARGNWDPRKGQQPFRPNPNGVGDRTTTLRRLLIGAVAQISEKTFGSFKQLLHDDVAIIKTHVNVSNLYY